MEKLAQEIRLVFRMRVMISFMVMFCVAPVTNFAKGFDESDLLRARALNQCELCDLREANLSELNFSEGNFEGADLRPT